MWIQGNADSCYGFLDVSSIPETVPNLAWIDFHTFWGSTQMLLLSWSLFLSLKLEAVLPSLNLHAFKDLLDTFYSVVKLTGPIKWVRNAVYITVIKLMISLWRIHSDLGFFFSSIFATQKICFWMPTLHFFITYRGTKYIETYLWQTLFSTSCRSYHSYSSHFILQTYRKLKGNIKEQRHLVVSLPELEK